MKLSQKQIESIEIKITDFYNLVQEHSDNGVFNDFRTNSFLQRYENYKYETIENTRSIIDEITKTTNYGKGIIRELLIDAIGEGYNLVNSFWRNNVRGVLDDLKGARLSRFEKYLHDLYLDKISNEEFFNYYTSEVSKVYNIIAYILFLKDSKKFVPLATTTFDSFFNHCGIDFKTTSHCSWENYCEYVAILDSIRVLLKEQLGLNVTLIDAHSFIWVSESKTWDEWRNRYKKECRISKKYTESVVKARKGQGLFRKRVISKWQGKSSVSSFNKTECMNAAHIKPWKDCNERECIDPDNGLLLTPNIDFLFDEGNGYITFDDNGKIVFSAYLSKDIEKEFGVSKDLKIHKLNEKTREYLKWHREHVFKK